MKKIPSSPVRGVRARLGVAAVLVGLLALAGGAARPVSAQPASFINITNVAQTPAAGVAATLSSTDQTTYVFYSLTLVSQSAWSHVVLSDSAPTVTPSGSGAAVVFVDHPDICTVGTPSGGFTCNIDKLSPNAPQTFNVVVQTPTSGDNLAVNPTVTGDESCNDSCNSSHQEVFTILPTPPSWTLQSLTDAPDTLTSYTNPTLTAKLHTNKVLSTTNPQSTEADVPGGLAPLGVLVSLTERNDPCPSAVTAAKLKCFGQTSDISVGHSGAGGIFSCPPPNAFPTLCGNSLFFTIKVAGSSLKTKVNLKNAALFHNGEKVPFCSTGHVDTTGDCALPFTQDSATGDITMPAVGPANSTWVGAG